MTETKYKIAIIQGLLSAPFAYLWYYSGISYQYLPSDVLYYLPAVVGIPLEGLLFSLPVVFLVGLIDLAGSGLKTWQYYLIYWVVTTVAAIALGFLVFMFAMSFGGGFF